MNRIEKIKKMLSCLCISYKDKNLILEKELEHYELIKQFADITESEDINNKIFDTSSTILSELKSLKRQLAIDMIFLKNKKECDCQNCLHKKIDKKFE